MRLGEKIREIEVVPAVIPVPERTHETTPEREPVVAEPAEIPEEVPAK